MAAVVIPKRSAASHSERPWLAVHGRQTASKTSAPTARRKKAAPPGPTVEKRCAARADPHWTEITAPRTSAVEGTLGAVGRGRDDARCDWLLTSHATRRACAPAVPVTRAVRRRSGVSIRAL